MTELEQIQEIKEYREILIPILQYLRSLKLIDIRNMQIVLDIDNDGNIRHNSMTRHFK